MPKVLLAGWDGAGWNQIHSLLNAGAMPNLARMVENGVMGELATMTPACPPLLWTSIGTGHFADRHQVLDAVEPDPRTGGVRGVTRASLAVPHVWDILARAGLQCQAIGWPATHPAAAPAICISDRFTQGVPGCIYPPDLESKIGPLRFDPREWTGDELQLFVPELARVDQDKDKRLARLAVILAESVSAHAAATTLMESSEWDFTAVWFGAAGRAYGVFGNEGGELCKDVMDGVYRFLDLLLGRLLELAGPETTALLVSDRAVSEPHWNVSTGCGPRGMLCASGPGIEPDELTFGSGPLDIAPTVLGVFGFTPAEGMRGRAIAEICTERPLRAVREIAPVERVRDELEEQLEQDLRELEKLGYTDPAVTKKPEVEAARTRRDFHLAQVLLAQGRASEAVPLLEPIAGADPQRADVRLYLANAYFNAGRKEECRALCEALLAAVPNSPFAHLTRAHLAIAEGNNLEAQAHLASGREVSGMAASLEAAIGETYLHFEKWEDAAAAFRSAICADSGLAAAHQGLAQALLGTGLYEDAAESALDAIRLRYDLPVVHRTLSRALRALGRDEEAARAFDTSEMLRDRITVP